MLQAPSPHQQNTEENRSRQAILRQDSGKYPVAVYHILLLLEQEKIIGRLCSPETCR